MTERQHVPALDTTMCFIECHGHYCWSVKNRTNTNRASSTLSRLNQPRDKSTSTFGDTLASINAVKAHARGDTLAMNLLAKFVREYEHSRSQLFTERKGSFAVARFSFFVQKIGTNHVPLVRRIVFRICEVASNP